MSTRARLRSVRSRSGLRRTILIMLSTPLVLSGCREAPTREAPPATVAVLDSFLVELGRTPTSELDRSQRWRMISSIWVGLPPPGYTRDSLPEPESHGAALMQTFCEQCHWMPSPAMHAAQEWPLLVRRMVLRARTVQERMGGPLTREIVGNERLLKGMAIARLPSDDEQAVLVDYLQAHALPVLDPGGLPDDPEAALFVDRCTICHETPSPAAHTPSEWEPTVGRMMRNMELMGIEPMAGEDMQALLAFLRRHAASPGAAGAAR